MTTTFRSLVFLLPLAIALPGCIEPESEAAVPAHDAAGPLPVETYRLAPRHWSYATEAYGSIFANEKVVIKADAAGTVEEVHAREGRRVAPGELLITLESNRQQLKLDSARAEVATASARLTKSRSTFTRYQALVDQQVVAEDEFRQVKAAYEADVAALAQARAAERLAQRDLAETRLTSPVGGVIESESVEPGQNVLPGEQLALVQAANALEVRTYVTEKEVNFFRVGDVGDVAVPGAMEQVFKARIESIASSADPRTGNFTVKLRIDEPWTGLREGMSARVRLQASKAQAVLAVPEAAVVDRDRHHVVFVVEDGKAIPRPVVTGLPVDGWVPVQAGLREGEQLIVSNQALLRDANAVTPTTTAMVAYKAGDG